MAKAGYGANYKMFRGKDPKRTPLDWAKLQLGSTKKYFSAYKGNSVAAKDGTLKGLKKSVKYWSSEVARLSGSRGSKSKGGGGGQ